MSQATATETTDEGVIESVSGPVVTATDLGARMNDVVYVGDEGLMGEVIEIEGDITTIQVYEETSDVAPGEPVENTGEPLSVDLGPGMLDSIYDGVQRPLDVLEERMGAFLDRGVDAPGIDLEKTWEFNPEVEVGDEVSAGDVVGIVPETESIDHKVLVPPGYEGGEVTAIESGNFTVEETVVELDSGEEIQMRQEWPVREPRPTVEKETPTTPLISGQRILDGLFPIAKGGTAAIPGPFGSGKTVTQHQLAKWADADIVIYVGCGERGNEMTEVIEDFPELEDPKTGKPLMSRTCLIANTSNMPVAARESCVYTGSRSPSTTATWATTWRSWPTPPRGGRRRCGRSPRGSRRCPARKGTPRISPRGWRSSTSAPATSRTSTAPRAPCRPSARYRRPAATSRSR